MGNYLAGFSEKLPEVSLCLMEPVPPGSETNLLLAKAELQTKLEQPLLSPAPAAVGGTQVDRWWSSSCRIWSWAFSKEPAPSLSPGSGFWVNILVSSCAPRIASGLSKVERRRKMKRKARVRIKPHINVGSDFQAELPELQARPPTEDEEHASLVWKPWEDTDSDMEMHDRVRDLLDMAISSGIPGAAANLELALHCLHEAQGNVPEALEMFQSGQPQIPQGHPLADYHYAGSDTWTPHEKESFQMAFHTYGKDFHLIQKEIQSKTVAQCVEYYYSWKKEHRIAPPPAQTVGRPKRSKNPPKEENGDVEKRGRRRPRSTVCPCCKPPQPPRSAGGLFPCRTCKRVFETMKERNRHERSHCPQKEDEPHPKKKRPN
ncbi:zinc finger protein 541-like [Chiroxiphia lanceolata]|uniref:zinc finger protein 541-like n=1 Tax=Chiroxiphia lanceolata TaxID=296741 RepID=UPI0013CE5BA6|nr:zinc finger protein 541-like [Chiroxiphia lanceolata]